MVAGISGQVSTAASRAAAFDPRIDSAVAYGALFDFGAIARRNIWLRDHGLGGLVQFLVGFKVRRDSGFALGIANAEWTFGESGTLAVADAFAPYTLRDVAGQITGDVLILAGTDDHFVPIEQAHQFAQALTRARSVTTRVYDRAFWGRRALPTRCGHALAGAFFRLDRKQVSRGRM
jgi:pimeloyl-ACP methyl ester carboxylesterase